VIECALVIGPADDAIVIWINSDAVCPAHDCAVPNLKRGLTMQDMHLITEGQASWLRILERREYEGLTDRIAIPNDVLDALVEKGLVRRWRDGGIAITLGGIKEVAQH
jgi:hypothetical protein